MLIPMVTPSVGRYTVGARLYDVLSGERLVYRGPRLTAIERLGLRPGDRVLDLACGTGLNLPLLREQVGPAGHVTAVDLSSAMLVEASRRVTDAGWTNVETVHGDAARLDDLVPTLAEPPPYDAVICTYGLSVIGPWEAAWAQAWGALRPGGRAAIVDLSLPSGRGLPWWPLARLACLTGGSDPHREPWRLAEDALDDVQRTEARAGHVVVVTGTRAVS